MSGVTLDEPGGDDENPGGGGDIDPIPGRNVIHQCQDIETSGGSTDMKVDGAATPTIFEFKPASGLYFATEIRIFLSSPGSMAEEKFGNLTALANGLKVTIQSNGSAETTVKIVKKNIEFFSCFEVGRVSPPEQKSLVASKAFLPNIRIDSAQGNFIRILVQDDLTPNGITALRAGVSTWIEV